jgi:hypothetical protein
MDQKFQHIKGLPALAEFILPSKPDTTYVEQALVELLKDTYKHGVKETLRRVFLVIDGVTFTEGKIHMRTAELKTLIEEAIK